MASRAGARKTPRKTAARKASTKRKASAEDESRRGAATASDTRAAKPKREKKDKRGKVVRDRFAMPEADYDLIAMLKKRCVALGIPMKKNELLRAGLGTLQQMPDDALRESVSAVTRAGTDRSPRKKAKGRKRDASEAQ